MLTTTITVRGKRNFLHDSQAVHRTIMHATDGAHHLWATPDYQHLVIRHEKPVDWSSTIRGIDQAVTIPTDVPITGVNVDYAIIGNPIFNVHMGDGKRGKKTAAPPEKWNAWLERRLGEALNLHSIDGERLADSKGKKPTMYTTHQRVLFTGRATVRNQEKLHGIMRDGAGPGKAYGCGLLLVEES